MSDQNRWKWAFTGLIVLFICVSVGYWFYSNYTDEVQSMNRRLSLETAVLASDIEDVNDEIEELKKAINSLDYDTRQEVNSLDDRISKLEDEVDRLSDRVDDLSSYNWDQDEEISELKGRIALLETYAQENGTFYIPELKDLRYCPYCGYPYPPYYPYNGYYP